MAAFTQVIPSVQLGGCILVAHFMPESNILGEGFEMNTCTGVGMDKGWRRSQSRCHSQSDPDPPSSLSSPVRPLPPISLFWTRHSTASVWLADSNYQKAAMAVFHLGVELLYIILSNAFMRGCNACFWTTDVKFPKKELSINILSFFGNGQLSCLSLCAIPVIWEAYFPTGALITPYESPS